MSFWQFFVLYLSRRISSFFCLKKSIFWDIPLNCKIRRYVSSWQQISLSSALAIQLNHWNREQKLTQHNKSWLIEFFSKFIPGFSLITNEAKSGSWNFLVCRSFFITWLNQSLLWLIQPRRPNSKVKKWENFYVKTDKSIALPNNIFLTTFWNIDPNAKLSVVLQLLWKRDTTSIVWAKFNNSLSHKVTSFFLNEDFWETFDKIANLVVIYQESYFSLNHSQSMTNERWCCQFRLPRRTKENFFLKMDKTFALQISQNWVFLVPKSFGKGFFGKSKNKFPKKLLKRKIS